MPIRTIYREFDHEVRRLLRMDWVDRHDEFFALFEKHEDRHTRKNLHLHIVFSMSSDQLLWGYAGPKKAGRVITLKNGPLKGTRQRTIPEFFSRRRTHV